LAAGLVVVWVLSSGVKFQKGGCCN
jgi:hypothetical protein